MKDGSCRPFDGFGKVFSTTLKTPVGNQTFSVDVPLESMADAALKAAMPPAMKYAIAELRPAIPGLLGPALDQVGQYAANKLWPMIQPKMQAEVDKTLEEVSRRAAVVAGVLTIVLLAGSGWIAGRMRKRAA